MALRTKLYLDVAIFCLILRSKIRQKMATSKEYFAAAGGKRLLHNPIIYRGSTGHIDLLTLFTATNGAKIKFLRIFCQGPSFFRREGIYLVGIV